MSDFATLKKKILKITGPDNWINLAVAKQKAGLTIIRTVADAEKVLRVLTKPRKITPPVPAMVRDRYNEAHKLWATRETPQAIRDHGWTAPVFPKVHTSNGLTAYIINLLTWHGYRATRISASGRKVAGKWIRGSTRPGSADISATCHGSWQIEVKVGQDKPSDKQLKEQEREQRAGGRYDFVKTAEGFIDLFDQVVYG